MNGVNIKRKLETGQINTGYGYHCKVVSLAGTGGRNGGRSVQNTSGGERENEVET